MQLTPSSPELRDPRSLRGRVDAKLGQGTGRSFAEMLFFGNREALDNLPATDGGGTT